DRIQEILFRTRRGLVYRGLFTVRGQTVYLLHTRGPGQNDLSPQELSLPPEEKSEGGTPGE
ncbi:MAG: hypothetical protein KDA79_17625, partial [Planctomycetaceae bacterium]|nr:hypothetical protein [Planctomycetaceae bacterium]